MRYRGPARLPRPAWLRRLGRQLPAVLPRAQMNWSTALYCAMPLPLSNSYSHSDCFRSKVDWNWNKMVSVLQNVKATMAWRKHRLLADFDENESPVPDKFKRRASLSCLNTIRMSLRKRVPLKQVELNFHKASTWESLEARQKCQTLHSIKRTAKNAFGTMSQKIQKSCQSPVHSMVTFPGESISRSCATSSTKQRSATPRTPCHKKSVTPAASSKGTPRSSKRALLGPTRVSEHREWKGLSVTPAASSKGTPRSSKRALLGPTRVSEHREWKGFSSWLGKDTVSLRRSRRAAALKSPYSSLAPASRKIEFDCQLELVSSGICQLKHISQAFDDAVVQEERQHAISNYYYLMEQNLQSVCRSRKLSQAIARRAKKLHRALDGLMPIITTLLCLKRRHPKQMRFQENFLPAENSTVRFLSLTTFSRGQSTALSLSPEVEGQSMEEGDDSPSTPEVSPRAEERTSCINTTSTRKRRRVIVVGDSLLRGTKGPICRTDPPLREVCCLRGPGAHRQSFKLDSKREGNNIRLARGKLRDDVPRLEGAGASEGTQPVSLRCAGYAGAQLKLNRVELGDTEAIGAKREMPVKRLKEHKGCSSMKETRTTAQLKCLYTIARGMGNKQEELEAIVHQENYDMVAIMETWWDDSHNWSAAMDGYKLFRRDTQGTRGGGVALYVRECLDSLELDDGDNKVECLWIRIRGKANKADIVVGVCYRPPNQDEKADELFYKQLGEASRSLALVLVGDFNLPDVSWKYNTAERKQSRRFLEHVADNFLNQLVREPTRKGAPLDLLFTNREGLVSHVMVGGRLGQSNHEMIEFLIHGEAARGVSRTATLDFWRADFGLFRRLVERVPWEAALKGKGVQEGWTFFKEEVLKAQERAVPRCRKDELAGKTTSLAE
ncbi:hypothetical protein QYF61_017114 [Mycteria americana]|uniref:Endonuclease/exonuclease/phosphatase domain-containing protein n=1 Tax=Mycteria americana TaxID=33587 RepID=A0AAN7MSH8_MYCAM|nr:hypothetical protein QYF61_017114 [Mycteria americana]